MLRKIHTLNFGMMKAPGHMGTAFLCAESWVGQSALPSTWGPGVPRTMLLSQESPLIGIGVSIVGAGPVAVGEMCLLPPHLVHFSRSFVFMSLLP